MTQTMAQVGMLDRFVEVMAAVGEKEREEMLKKYEAAMPKEFGEGYVAASRAAIEKAVREKGDEMERVRKVELIREEVRRRYFRENSGPEDILCQMGIGVGTTAHVDFEVFRYFLKRLMDLKWSLKEGRDQEQRMREERLEWVKAW